jgi:catechol 2,3-dioxygenase-like lactoylglutathione lyase family enzyme
MFDHVGLNVRDYRASRAFYEEALAPLGYRVVFDGSEWNGAGFGTSDDKPEFWVMQREPCGTGTHVAFQCGDRAMVDAFHAAGLAAGGTDNGAPGVRLSRSHDRWRPRGSPPPASRMTGRELRSPP